MRFITSHVTALCSSPGVACTALHHRAAPCSCHGLPVLPGSSRPIIHHGFPGSLPEPVSTILSSISCSIPPSTCPAMGSP